MTERLWGRESGEQAYWAREVGRVRFRERRVLCHLTVRQQTWHKIATP
jgi:hypothetical protein